MKLVQSLLGRRQFLIAAGVTSTAALAFKKIGRIVDPGKPGGISLAADARGASKRYANLLSPLKIGNVVLKNRMYSTAAIPHNLQGPETFPAETSRFYAANLARNGAAIVTCRIITNRVRKELSGDSAHMVIYDLEDAGVQNYLDQLVEGIHCYGSKATASINITLPGQSGPGMPSGMMPGQGEMPEGERGDGPPGEGMGMPGGGSQGEGMQAGGQQMMAMMASLSSPAQEISAEVAEQLIEDAVTEAKFYHTHGFDMVTMRVPNVVDREKFGIDLYGAVKKACGQDFLIESPITVIDASVNSTETASAFTQDQAVALAKKWENVVDILQIRVSGGTANHPDGYNQEKNNPLPLPFATAIKKSGAKTIAAPNGGFANHDFNEECVATGKLDLIAMGRPFIADWEYAEKAFDGRGEDVAPCIMCNKCHGTQSAPWISFCSVNPKMGIDSATQAIKAPTRSKKVAVIGGGPAGMKAAVIAAERGHQVTLYEKNSYLGGQQGQLVAASSFKWPVKDLMDYLALQMEKSGVDVKLGIAATPEMIGKKNYDAILVALGSDPVIPNIKGADGRNVYSVLDVFGKEKSLGKDVVFIGAGQYGMDVAIYLASLGLNVTALSASRSLIQPTGPHQLSSMIEKYQEMKNFTAITGVTPTRISGGKVTYTDANGKEQTVTADSVVLYSGLKARQEEAVAFGGLASQCHVIGECGGGLSGIQASQRSAFFAASQV
jgi:2,4-dienoyl-CoA reductase-like NADH-dependent reductase (Old Yellow Enzyme family)/thioredoxin reductase